MDQIYLDVCCLNRPFDDQTQERVRLEAEAVLLILSRCQSHRLQLIGSEVVDYEISLIPEMEKRQKVQLLATLAASRVIVTEEIENRATKLANLGFNTFDVLHLACAEEGGADILLTTDDRFLSAAKRNAYMLNVRVENPVICLIGIER